ncbi:hypothetical protein A6F68_00577 [Tsuneonella dongtanensis]|uniref:SH3b domain-containing protein n=1 Tax=Tsuneonella dongtanensis TaxID=692370 RepID=A0A1B2AAB8_9SPHN|nr:SH3 domain-containing protein [Tsuneonella dongtanensis]ANY19110.1 hypothetical protein A6F68_00577 [Tsuneonella dongtanensis]
MMTSVRKTIAFIAATATIACGTSAHAAEKATAPTLMKCEQSLGTIALVDGDLAGWTEYGLGSPRALINALATESGCFTPHVSTSAPARFLVTAVAGNQEEVDKSVEVGKAAATEALVRSGAAGKVLGGLGGFGGTALGMFGGLGGKKKTYAAGLRVVSPATGQALASGSGSVKKSSITFGNSGGWGWANNAASASGYQGSKDGQALTEAFILAFNQLIAQKTLLEGAPAAGAAAVGPVSAAASVAVDAKLYAGASKTSAVVRSIRAGTELTPTGKREGLFVEVTDNYGTKGWVSVEDLK